MSRVWISLGLGVFFLIPVISSVAKLVGGKLPGPVIGVDYALEYGTARMELRPDSVHEGDRVLVIDDVMATGGTAKASVQLLEQAGARVEAICVLLELEGLGGRNVIDQSIFEPIVVIED